MNENQRTKYFIKYGLALAFAHFGVTLAGVSFLLMFHIGKLDNSNKALKKTVEKMEQVDDSFHSILKMERMKEDYRKQGILEEGL